MTEQAQLFPCLHLLKASAALRVLWALEELNESHNVQFSLKVYERDWKGNPTKAFHPMGKSPVLCIGPNPEQAIAETRLILQYIADAYSNGIWTPISQEDKTRDTNFQEFAGASLLAKTDFALMFDLPDLAYPFGIRHLAKLFYWPFKTHMLGDLRLHYQYMEDALSDEKPWFAGPSRGLSDFITIFAMDMASQRGYFPSQHFPKLQGWQDRVHALPAYQRALKRAGGNDLKNIK